IPSLSLSLLLSLPPPSSTLFPYTTLFRSLTVNAALAAPAPGGVAGKHHRVAAAERLHRQHDARLAVRRLHVRVHGEDARRGLLRSEEHTSELQSQSNLVCRLLLEKKKTQR